MENSLSHEGLLAAPALAPVTAHNAPHLQRWQRSQQRILHAQVAAQRDIARRAHLHEQAEPTAQTASVTAQWATAA